MFNYNFCHFPQFIVCNVFIDELGGGGGISSIVTFGLKQIGYE